MTTRITDAEKDRILDLKAEGMNCSAIGREKGEDWLNAEASLYLAATRIIAQAEESQRKSYRTTVEVE